MLSLGILLIAAGILMAITALAHAAIFGWQRRRAERWARTPHPHAWRVTGASPWGEGTAVTEECRFCPAVRASWREGAWGFNRFGDLVNAGAELEQLRRLAGLGS